MFDGLLPLLGAVSERLPNHAHKKAQDGLDALWRAAVVAGKADRQLAEEVRKAWTVVQVRTAESYEPDGAGGQVLAEGKAPDLYGSVSDFDDVLERFSTYLAAKIR